jgi:hypothetical protein
MVKVSPDIWSVVLSTRPLTMPVTVTGLLGWLMNESFPEKLKLKLSAEAAPAWRQLINSAALKAARPMNVLRWIGREWISANWLDLGASEVSWSMIEV